jgi:hypothetical protein
MADEISNRALAILLISAIVVSLGGTLISLNRLSRLSAMTGFITNPQGTAQVNVSQTAALQFSISNLNFGIGSVNTTTGGNACSMASGNNSAGYKDGVTRCIDFNEANTFNSLEIENYGNRNLTLTLNSNKNADTFIGGTNPGFKFYVTNNETNACPSPVPDAWADVNASVEMNICSGTGLDFTDNADSLDIHLNITIPYNSKTGQQTVTLTVTGQPLV